MDRTTLKRLVSHNKEERLAALRAKKTETRKIPDEEILKVYNETKNVKEVNITVHTSSCNVVIGKISGIKADSITEEERAFLSKCSNNTKLEMFPVYQKKLNSVTAKVHIKQKECSIGDSCLMEVETFEKKYLPAIKKLQEEMDEIKEKIVDEFEDRLIEFEAETMNIVSKMYSDIGKIESVREQLDFLKKRGAQGYVSRIGIEINTKFSAEDTVNLDEEMADFMRQCKEVSDRNQANRIICSLFDELWVADLSYLINISLDRYSVNSDLVTYTTLRKKLLERALKVRRESKPLEAIGLTEPASISYELESLSQIEDKYDAQDAGYDILVLIYATARDNYGYELSIRKSDTGGKVPDWINMSEIITDAEALIKGNKTSRVTKPNDEVY